jgi:hypothetical protein
MPEVRTFTLMSAQPRLVTPRDPSKNAFTLYEIFDNQGGKWVVRQDVYNHALPLIGQLVTAVCRVEQNGQYTNFFIDSVDPAGGGPTYVPAQQAQTAQAQYAPTPQQTQQIPVQPMMAQTERERQQSIHRQTAGKVAAGISSTADEFWSNVQAIFHWFETGQIPQTVATQQTAESMQRPNAAAYHQNDPGPQPGQYDGMADDIPF